MTSTLKVMFFLMTVGTHFAFAQQPITVSLYNEATAVPFTTFVNSPVHPGIQVGTEFEWKENNIFRWYPAINIGYMFHKRLFQGLYANMEVGLDIKTGLGLNLKTKLGLGYLHTFSTQQEYQFKDGAYVSNPDKGNPRFMPSFTLGMGYNLRKNDPQSTEIFVLYQSWIEYPYSPGFIPLMSHTNIHLGTRFYPIRNK